MHFNHDTSIYTVPKRDIAADGIFLQLELTPNRTRAKTEAARVTT